MKKNYILIFLLCIPYVGFAFSWQDLWYTPDQQASNYMQKKQYKKASELFENTAWQASAAYKAGLYKKALEGFKQLNFADAAYNEGNTQAHLGEYQKAIEAYDRALELNSRHEDAKYNRELIKKLLEKQQKNQKEDNKSDQNDQKKPNQPPETEKDQKNKDNQEKDGQKKPENKNNENKKPEPAGNNQSDAEKKRAQKQWLQLIPKEPDGLMRQKLLREYLHRHQSVGSTS